MIGRLPTLAITVTAALLASSASGQFLIDFDLEFEGPLPSGPTDNPGGLSGIYQFHGPTGNVGTPEYNLDFQQAFSPDGNGGLAYEQSMDSTGLDVETGLFPPPFFFYTGGGGGFFVPETSGMTGLGDDNPANYTFSVDLNVTGQVADVPIYFGFGQFDADYEATYGVDITGGPNGEPDGDMLDGADTWVVGDVPATLAMTSGFQTFSVSLADALSSGSGLTAGDGVAPENIRFDNENSLYFSWYYGHTEFGFDSGNSVMFDNIAFDFQAVTPIGGDFNLDGVVDAADYTVYRDALGVGDNDALSGNGDESGPSAGVVDGADYALWAANYGSTGGAPAFAVPEPAGLMIVALATLVSATRGRRLQAADCN